jgi:hypothetical protein
VVRAVPALSLSIDAFVLDRRPPSDAFQSLLVFSATHGALWVMQRIGRRAATALAMDLFDEVTLILESSNQGRTWFVREARLITRHAGIGRGYATLQHAAALARLITRNAITEEGWSGTARLLRTALGALDTGVRPDVARFKATFVFARDEGHPLQQQWLPTLPADDRTQVATLLNRPLAEQTAAVEAVTRLQRRLEEFLQGHTEMSFDD